MADYIVVNGARRYAAGVISEMDAQSLGGAAPASRATMAILYEGARGGEPKVPYIYTSGARMKDALEAKQAHYFSKYAFTPSRDTERIPGGAERVVTMRVNPATQASLTLVDDGAVDAAVVAAKDWGLYGNDIKVEIVAGSTSGKKLTVTHGSDVETFDNIGDLDVFSAAYTPDGVHAVEAMEASVDPNVVAGGDPVFKVAYDFDITGGTAAFDPRAWMAFDGQITVTLSVAQATTVTVTITGTNKATGAALTETLSFTGTVPGPAVTTRTTSAAFSDVSSIDVSAIDGGTTVTFTGNAFALDIEQYDTVAKVRDRVTTVGRGFAVTLLTAQVNFLLADMDLTEDSDINDTSATFAADLYDFIDGVDSAIVDVERADDAEALVANLSETQLAGGANNMGGGSISTDVTAACAELAELGIVHLVLMVEDFASVQAALTWADSMKGIYPVRIYAGAPAQTKLTEAGTPGGLYQRTAALNSRLAAYAIQEILDYDENGDLEYLAPMYQALLAAGCEAGRANDSSILWAQPNVQGFRDYPGSNAYNWTSRDNKEELIEHGCLFLERIAGTSRIRWATEGTTYQTDNNPIWSSIVANESADISTLNVRLRLEFLIGKLNTKGGVTTGRVQEWCAEELERQVNEGEITAVEAESIAAEAISGGFDVSYNFQPAEAVKWIRHRAHIRRLSTAA